MKRLISAVLLFVLSFNVRADEGMWLPVLLEQLNITDMKARGFMLTAEDVYSVNKTSMKDAVCLFGGGCTAELISNRGLLLTNHHCGFGAIQYHSSVQHDYLTDGFWAMNQKEELHTPGVTATFILSMRDVTNEVLADVTSSMDEVKRNEAIGKAIKNLEKKYSTTDAQAMIRAFYYGNVFYLFMTETFTDLRMVGAPPMSIGNFGGDTDNWVWPRHTADFSLFRIYAGKDNKPAPYSEENIPWTPRNFFTLNCKGIQPGDFTMVYGFPGRTTEYLTSWGVELVANISDPLKVNLRTMRINLMVAEMNKSAEVRIKYAAKRNGVANAWKKWQGEMKGIKDNDVIRKKQLQEAEFSARLQRNQEWQNKYGNLLTDLAAAH
ncbi:MAG: S46 family peptidase, partial [Bacteroidetes bacterium]|nr:S46 family peptidase [Bacteroidota bacterium]